MRDAFWKLCVYRLRVRNKYFHVNWLKCVGVVETDGEWWGGQSKIVSILFIALAALTRCACLCVPGCVYVYRWSFGRYIIIGSLVVCVHVVRVYKKQKLNLYNRPKNDKRNQVTGLWAAVKQSKHPTTNGRWLKYNEVCVVCTKFKRNW